jgi:hypothetical protein
MTGYDTAAADPHTGGKLTFEMWLDALEVIMKAWDDKHGNLPYDLPLERTGHPGNVNSWRDSYDDGMTPQEAFDSDQTYWEE